MKLSYDNKTVYLHAPNGPLLPLCLQAEARFHDTETTEDLEAYTFKGLPAVLGDSEAFPLEVRSRFLFL